MSTPTTASKLETVIDKRTGDQPAETPGHVIPGKDLRRRLGVVAPEKTEDIPPEKPDVEKSEVSVAVTPEVKPAARRGKKPSKTPPVPVQPALDTETLTTAVAAGVKAAMTPEKKEVAVADPTANLGPKQKRTYTVLARMELANPENKGKAKQYLDSQSKFQEYKSKWEQDHPGKKFDIEDEDHSEFLSANDVSYDADEYTEALADLKAEERAASAMKPLEEKLRQQEYEVKMAKRAADMVPRIDGHQKITAKVFFNQLGDPFKGVLDERGAVVRPEIDRMVKENPANVKVFQAAQQTELVAGELMKIATGLVEFSDKNPVHVAILGFANKQEREMMALPADQRMNDEGKAFAPSAEWNKMTESQRKTHWTYSDAELSTLYAFEMADFAKKEIERSDKEFNERLDKMGIKRPASTTPAPTAAKPVATPEQPRTQERSPAGAVAPRMAPVAGQSKNTNSPTKPLLQRLVG